MGRFYFGTNNMITIGVNGKVYLKKAKGMYEIKIDGEFCNSGCQDENLIKAIGLNNIKMLSDNSELLKHFTDDELIDEICNNRNRDFDEIVRQLDESDQPL